MQSIRFNQQGFTLAELIIGMSLTVLLLTGVGTMLSVNVQSWLTGSSRAEVQQTARYAMNMMVRDLQLSEKLPDADPQKNYTFRLITGIDGADNYILEYKDARSKKIYRYYLDKTATDTKKKYILYKHQMDTGTKQPVTGESLTAIVINKNNEPLFELLDDNTVLITLIATDIVTNQSYETRTVVRSLTQHLQ